MRHNTSPTLFERQQSLYWQNLHTFWKLQLLYSTFDMNTLFFLHFSKVLTHGLHLFLQCLLYNFISFSQFFFDFKQFSVLIILCSFCFSSILHQFFKSLLVRFIVIILSIHLLRDFTFPNNWIRMLYIVIIYNAMIIIKRNDITFWLHSFMIWNRYDRKREKKESTWQFADGRTWDHQYVYNAYTD